MKTKTKWTDKDISFIRLNYPTQGAEYCASMLNKTISAIKTRANILSLKILKEDLTGKDFGYLTVINKCNYKRYNKNIWKCLCKCGNVLDVFASDLRTGHTKSCGCFNKEQTRKGLLKDLTNKKFNKLLVQDLAYSKDSYIYWNCICDCGKRCIVTGKHLKSGNTKTCGNCKNYRNGVATSFKALQLHNIINKGIHNYRTKCGAVVDIAFVENGYKIAIEYDEWYWHKDKQEKDKKRLAKLICNGWKILQIKANKNLPNYQQIFIGINNLLYTDKNIEIITLEGWGTYES